MSMTNVALSAVVRVEIGGALMPAGGAGNVTRIARSWPSCGPGNSCTGTWLQGATMAGGSEKASVNCGLPQPTTHAATARSAKARAANEGMSRRRLAHSARSSKRDRAASVRLITLVLSKTALQVGIGFENRHRLMTG